jgi:pimeloyl-ACP methyl ester carboxylesterase
MGDRRLIDVTGGVIEVDVARGDAGAPTLVFLHEGLGSIDLWRGFQDDVRRQVGDWSAVTYSRHGYGRSAPARVPRPVDYMHHEADVILPELLRALGVERPWLIGHSDGASIALLFAGAGHAVAGLVCLAPHVFVEPDSVAGVAAAVATFESTDMAERMLRYHDDPEATFRSWSDIWASDEFRSWNIEERLPAISAPVYVVQGTADRYGTVAQVDAIAVGLSGPCDRLVLEGVGHAPHLEARGRVVDAVAAFVRGWSSQDESAGASP